MSVDTIDYGVGRKLQAGIVTTDQIPLGIDTYYPGMLLEFQKAGTAVTTGTGNGVASDIIAGASVKSGVYTCLFTAALVCDLKDPDGNVIAKGLVVPDGSSATFKINGITFTLTDGGTAWVATDTIAMTIATTGTYVALASGILGAIYNAVERILSSAGVGDCIMGGEIDETGLVSNANVTLVLTEAQRAEYSAAGFYIKRA
jgi:hypothetical protein